MKQWAALTLGLLVALHQIPGRRILLQTIWEQSGKPKLLAATTDSLNSETIKKTPHTFRRCRPCVVKKITLERPIDVAHVYLPLDSYHDKFRISSPIDLPLHLHPGQAASPDLTRAPPITTLI